MNSSTIELVAHDGHHFKAYKAMPDGKPRGAIIVGPDERAEGVVVVRELSGGEEVRVAFDRLVESH